jgi:predicted nucleotidyltransferase
LERNYLTKEDIEKIVNEIKKTVETERIYLFGSYAKNNFRKYSDIDLCIITNEKDKRKLDLIKKIRKNLRKVTSFPLDILVYYTDEFDERSSNKSTFENTIVKEGKKIA